MPTVPVRGLADKGVLHDPSPYELDQNAWSAAVNMRFHANKAERAPIFRTVYDALPEEPVFCVGLEPSSGFDKVVLFGADGRIWNYTSGAVTEVSALGVNTPVITNAGTGYSSGSPPAVTFSAPTVAGGRAATGAAVVAGGGTVTGITIADPGSYPTGSAVPTVTIAAPVSGTTATAITTFQWRPSTDPRAVTATFLGDVLYLNRPNQAPQYFGPNSVNFAPIPNQETTWTCRSLRVYGDYLVALNVTKPDPIGNIKGMVKWSDLTLVGQTPGSWNPDDPTTNAGENVLEEVTTPLVDGLPMKQNFIIYSEDAIFGMSQIDSSEIFEFGLLFKEGGMVAPNCAVEVQGIHYVFGPKDIYKHDGTTKVSIVDRRNKDFIFRNLNNKLSEVCFVSYLEQYGCIVFGYNTGDPSAVFQGADRCNQGAVYDIESDTWGFIDLPNVSSMSVANLDMVLTWATAPGTLTWANVGGSYYDQDNSFVKNVVVCSGALAGSLTNSRLAAYDFKDKGSLSFAFEPEMNGPALLERTGFDLDALGADLNVYKIIRRILPLVTVYNDVPVTIQVGGSNTPSGNISWNTPVTFDPVSDYKVDCMVGGRYLAIRFSVPSPADFEVAGFDLDIVNGGSR